ncbi:MAG: hypothetical protein NVS1B11_04390 [Terriglobales bacterium]
MLLLLPLNLATIPLVSAQTSGKTVHHHKVVEEISMESPDLAAAENAIEKKEYSTAQPLLEKVVFASPNDYQAWFDLGFVQNALGHPEESIVAYRRSVAIKPDVFESNLNLGLMLSKSNNPEAERFLRAATQLKPTSHVEEGQVRAWLSLGHTLEGSKPTEAIDAYQRAALLQPNDSEPHQSAGLLFEKQNQFAEAEQEYRKVLANDAESPDALTGLANIYMRGQRFPEAEQILQKLIAIRPSDAAARMQLSRILFAAGKKDDAMSELQEVLKLEPNNTDAQHDLAGLYLEQKRYGEAVSLYRSLIAQSPADAELRDNLGEALLNDKKFPEAQQEFLTAVKLKPDFGVAYGNLAVAASENKDYALAIKAADARAKFLPEIPVSFYLRATAYDHLREYKQAAENYRTFLELAGGKYPDQEWQARHRLLAIDKKK